MVKKINEETLERNPAEPIGNPPGGGSWTWNLQSQAWEQIADPVQNSVVE